MATNGCDLVPGWLTHECVYKDLCQCHLLGTRSQGWYRPGALYSNVVCHRFQLFERRCGCSRDGSQLPWDFHNQNARGLEVATGLSRILMHVLTDAPPSVPPRGEPVVSVLTSRKRKPKWERARLRGIRRRYLEKMYRRDCRVEREMSGYVDESDGEESSEEESIA